MEDNDNPSTIFKSLLGQITQEQWETYKELRRVSGELVCSESSDSVTSEDEVESADESTSKEKKLEGGNDDAEISEEEGEQTTWKPDLTVKYLNGELSFTEFEKIMEETHAKDEPKLSASGSDTSKSKEDIEKAKMEFEEELEIKMKKRRRARCRLPKDLQGLMGEANMCFAHGDHEDAIKMCMEIIRLAPTAPEPFQTLGMLYEELGDMEKAVQFSMIAAYLNPGNYEDWVKVAEMHTDQGNIKEAIFCFNKAIRCNPKNIGFLWERCNLYEQLGDKKKALDGYEAIVESLTTDQGDQCLQLSREIVKIYHELGNISAAAQAMEKAFEKFPSSITSEDVNTLLELKMSLDQYEDSVKVLNVHCGIEFEPPIDSFNSESLQNVKQCSYPECLPIDLQVKLIICLIRLHAADLADELSAPLYEEDTESVGDLYLHIAEAYIAVSQHQKALRILEMLVNTEKFYLAAVLLLYADCLNALGRKEEAILNYKKVIEMAPSHTGAKMSLANVLEDMGRQKEAANALIQEYEVGNEEAPIDIDVLWRRCNLLYSSEMWPEFTEAGKVLLSKQFLMLERPAEFEAVVTARLRRRKYVSNVHQYIGYPEKPEPVFIGSDKSVEEMWEFYLKYCHKIFELNDLKTLRKVALSALASHNFCKDLQRKKDCEFLAFLACYHSRTATYAYSLIKDMVVRNVNSCKVWNIFCQVINMLQDIRHNRFCLRLMMKHPDSIVLGLLNGHSAVLAGSYKHALGEYMCVFRQTPTDPFVCMCIGLTFIHMACQKYTVRRHSQIAQGCAFLNRYLELRGECQETYYNLGRAMHQLGLLSSALHYYKKGLSLMPPVDSNHKSLDVLDLRCEIAYNISLIYQSSGAYDLAKMYIQKYCIM